MSIADLLANAGGVPSAFTKHTPIGTVVQGRIVDAQVRQARNYEDGEPMWWDAEKTQPRQQVAVIIQTDFRDPAIEGDDGRRGIYVKWWGDSRTELIRAIKAAGDTDVRPGGMFAARYKGDKPSDNPKLNDTKLYEYKYQKPATGLDFGADQQTGEIPPAAAPAPAQTPGMVGGFPATTQAQPAPQAYAQPTMDPGPAAAPGQDPWGAQPAQQSAPAQDPYAAAAGWAQPTGQVQQAAPDAAAQALMQQRLAAEPVAQQPAPAAQPAPTAGAQVDVAKVRQLLQLGLDDHTVAGAAGTTPEVVASIRNLPA